MDKKYVGKVIAVKPEILVELESLREMLTHKLGFKPSLAETISWLIAQYRSKTQENF